MEVGILSSAAANKAPAETCVVCEKTKSVGIHLYTSFLCEECEHDIINTGTDNPMYHYYLKQLKKVNVPEICS
ncbi:MULTISPECIES: sigma factor G inhibitor Gin [unclassified Bacillus (in: firmicutes)]|uniref:sigma factor G inhibitor Gin n=1 Tax=Bacillus sp. MUM 13 TaxID=1678001 RepID=UPI0008F5A663|nr:MULTISPECIES: sigma factor G inhibitor Gin [unclassified Bacillus (in: firmicutes)]OIK08796.1 sigma factor G inhibitor Gin [Bacillus sp. MUM 13]